MANREKLPFPKYAMNSAVLWITVMLTTIFLFSFIFLGGMYVFLELLEATIQKIDTPIHIIYQLLLGLPIAAIILVVVGGLAFLDIFVAEFIFDKIVDRYCRKKGVCFHEKRFDQHRCKYLQEESRKEQLEYEKNNPQISYSHKTQGDEDQVSLNISEDHSQSELDDHDAVFDSEILNKTKVFRENLRGVDNNYKDIIDQLSYYAKEDRENIVNRLEKVKKNT